MTAHRITVRPFWFMLYIICHTGTAATAIQLPSYAGHPYDVTVAGSKILVSSDSGLTILSPSGSLSPEVTGFCKLEGWGYTVTIENDIAYVGGANENTLHCIDVSNPEHPVLLTTVHSDLGGVWDITLHHTSQGQSIAAVATAAGAALYDLSQPSQPELISVYTPYQKDTLRDTPDSAYYYIKKQYSDTGYIQFLTGLDTCRVPETFQYITRKTDAISFENNIATLLYYDADPCGSGIYMKSLDITDPATPLCIDSMALFSTGCALDVYNGTLLAGHDYGLDIITQDHSGHFSNARKHMRRVLMSIEGIDIVQGLAFVSSYAHTFTTPAQGQVTILDIRSPDTAIISDTIPLSGRLAGICAKDTSVYCVGDSGLHAFHFTPPAGWQVAVSSEHRSPHRPSLRFRNTAESTVVYSLCGKKLGQLKHFSANNLPDGCYIFSSTDKSGRRTVCKNLRWNKNRK